MNKIQFRHRLASSWGRQPIMWWQHRTISEQDIMVASYPRSGNTWLRFLLYELVTGKTADFSTINDKQSPCADFPHFQETPVISPLSGRMIKTHEPYRKEYGRAIYLVRDPRDVAVSEYHYMHGRGLRKDSLTDFVNEFVHGNINGYGSWHHHVSSWLDAPISDLLIVRYEDLKQTGCDTLRNIATFLGMDVSRDRLESILLHNTPQKMRQSEEKAPREAFRFVNENARFVRHGQINDWQKMLTSTQVEQIMKVMNSAMDQLGYR